MSFAAHTVGDFQCLGRNEEAIGSTGDAVGSTSNGSAASGADCFLHDLLGDGGLSLRKERALYLSGDLSGPVQLNAYGVFQDVRPAGSPSLLWW